MVGPIPARRVPNRNLPKVTEEEKRERRREYARKHYEANREKCKELQRDWYLANREHCLARQREYNAANPPTKEQRVASRTKSRLRSFGLTQDQYDTMLTGQNSSCAICHTSEPGGWGTFHIDHCHTTGKVRGLLCHHCNVGLGHFRDDPTSLSRAIAYLATQGNIDGTSQAP